eukprot:342831-Prorocentrum_minimum.AAC.1
MDDLEVYGPRVYKLEHSRAERLGLVKPLQVVRADWLAEAPQVRLGGQRGRTHKRAGRIHKRAG